VYYFLTVAEEPVDRSTIDNVWHQKVLLKVSLFAWRLLRNMIPTRDNLVRRRVIQAAANVCTGGCGSKESTIHLFLGCNVFSRLWSFIWNWLGIFTIDPCELHDHFHQFGHFAGLPRSSHSFLRLIWLAAVWIIWNERNNKEFKNMALDVHMLLDKVKLLSFVWLKANMFTFVFDYHNWWRYPLLCMG